MIAGGVLLCLTGATVDNLGVTLQKLSHREHAGREEVPYYRRRKWCFGFALFLTGNLINLVGLSMLPQAIFACMGGFVLVINALTARGFLGEYINTQMVAGIALVILGGTLSVLFAPHKSQSHSLYDIGDAFDLGFLLFLTVLMLFMATLYTSIRRLEERQNALLADVSPAPGFREMDIDLEDLDSSADSLPSFGLSEPMMPQPTGWKRGLLQMGYPVLAGMFGGLTQLIAKIGTEMIQNSPTGSDSVFRGPWPYIVICAVLCTGVSQIHTLNMGLRRSDQMMVIPIAAVALETSSIVIGSVFWDDAKDLSATRAALFPFAVLLTFAGVFVLAKGRGLSKAT